jgi:hypothetical protein
MSQGKSALNIVRKYHPQVTSVVDAKKPVTIEVTAKDCKDGKRKGPSSCAMACAAKRDYDGAIISLSTAYLVKGNKATRYLVPQAVSREIVSFDRAKKFEPGEYALNAPPDSMTISVIRERSAGKKKGRHKNAAGQRYTGTRTRNHRTAGIRAL